MTKMTIQLTTEQQQQIKAATGKELTELHVMIDNQGELPDSELGQVAGGLKKGDPITFYN